MASLPLWFRPAPVADFLLWASENQAPGSMLIICHERQHFQSILQASLEHAESQAAVSPSLTGIDDRNDDNTRSRRHPLRARTLRVLAATAALKLVYCPSVSVLHAYLSTLPTYIEEDRISKHPLNSSETVLLGIVNVVSLHRRTGPFSAQNLGTAFAAAVEAAQRCGARLVVFESYDPVPSTGVEDLNASLDANATVESNDDDNEGHIETSHSNDIVEQEVTHVATALHRSNEEVAGEYADLPEDARRSSHPENPWEEEIPIVNSATKAFGMSADRSWMTRKVKVAAVVQRWCQLQDLPSTST